MTMRPPGLSTQISCSALWGSLRRCAGRRRATASKVSSSKGRAVTSACTKVGEGRRRPTSSMPSERSAAMTSTPASAKGSEETPVPSGYVQHPRLGLLSDGSRSSIVALYVSRSHTPIESEDAVRRRSAFWLTAGTMAAMSPVFLFRGLRGLRGCSSLRSRSQLWHGGYQIR